MNDTGAKKWNVRHAIGSLLQGSNHLHETLSATRKQSRTLLVSGKLDNKQADIVSRYIDFFDYGYLFKRLEIIRM